MKKVNDALEHGAGWFATAITATVVFLYLMFDMLSK